MRIPPPHTLFKSQRVRCSVHHSRTLLGRVCRCRCDGGAAEADLLGFLRHAQNAFRSSGGGNGGARTSDAPGRGEGLRYKGGRSGAFADLYFQDYLEHVKRNGECRAVAAFRRVILDEP